MGGGASKIDNDASITESGGFRGFLSTEPGRCELKPCCPSKSENFDFLEIFTRIERIRGWRRTVVLTDIYVSKNPGLKKHHFSLPVFGYFAKPDTRQHQSHIIRPLLS